MATVNKRMQFQDLFSEVFVYTGTLDIASTVDAAGVSSTITVPGVALGDVVLGVSLGVSTVGTLVVANVTAANTVIVRFQNESAGTVDLASTTLRLVIGRVSSQVSYI